MMKITAEMAYQAWCVATFEETRAWSQLYQSQQARFVVMADWLNGQLAPQETRIDEEDDDVWYPCAPQSCAHVREAGALCEACLACEELGFSVQPQEEPPDEEARIEAMSQHWEERKNIERDYVERPW